MFERFTDRARMVVVKAQEESRLLGHDYIGTEHLLLGLLAEGDGIAGKALTDLGLTLESLRKAVEQTVGRGDGVPSGQHIPFTKNAKSALDKGLRQALFLGHGYIGTEHLLLGLLTVEESAAQNVLEQVDIEPGKLRQRVLVRLSADSIVTKHGYPRNLDNIEFDLALAQARVVVLENELADAQARAVEQPQEV